MRAVAAALRTEYQAIVDRGLLLQIDAPDLALERHTLFADRPLSEFLAWVELVVDAINGALEGIDPDAVRLHVCWGNYEGPHTHDVALDEIQPLLYEANVGALVISMANARHAHEVRCFERRPLPDHMALVAGVIDTTSNYVEHPEVVADRIVLAARAVGDPSRVIAGTDCGFDTSAGIGDVAPSLVWEKLAALRRADLATGRCSASRPRRPPWPLLRWRSVARAPPPRPLLGRSGRRGCRSARPTAASPRAEPPLMRPMAVSTKLAASNSSTRGRSLRSPGSSATPSALTDTRVSPALLPLIRTPSSKGSMSAQSAVDCQTMKQNGTSRSAASPSRACEPPAPWRMSQVCTA